MSNVVALVRLFTALISGGMVRIGRKLFGLPPRVVHGIYPMHMTKAMVAADRLAGFPSMSIVSHTSLASYALVTSSDFDLVLSDAADGTPSHWRAATEILRRADIWVTY